VALVAPFIGIVEDVDPRTRWVRFQSLDIDTSETPDSYSARAATMAATLADQGVTADRIRWVQVEGEERIPFT
jgi:hypothetical protein